MKIYIVIYGILVLMQLLMVGSFVMDGVYKKKSGVIWDLVFCVIPMGPVIRRGGLFGIEFVMFVIYSFFARFKSLR